VVAVPFQVVIWLRALMGLLLAVTLVVAVVPLLVLLNLAGGNTGYGICPHGLESCQVGYTGGLELLFVLTVVLFALLGAIRVVARGIRHLQRQQEIDESIRRLSERV
jgi:hypothetical protein